MKIKAIAFALLVAGGASTLAAAAADAQPLHRHGFDRHHGRARVCRTYFRHGHRERICRFR